MRRVSFPSPRTKIAVSIILFLTIFIIAIREINIFIHDVGTHRVLTDITIHDQTPYWRNEIRMYGAKVAYQHALRFSNGLSMVEQHDLGHVFGNALFDEDNAAGPSVCSGDFLYGCFHQFVARTIQARGESVISELFKKCPKNGGQYIGTRMYARDRAWHSGSFWI